MFFSPHPCAPLSHICCSHCEWVKLLHVGPWRDWTSDLIWCWGETIKATSSLRKSSKQSGWTQPWRWIAEPYGTPRDAGFPNLNWTVKSLKVGVPKPVWDAVHCWSLWSLSVTKAIESLSPKFITKVSSISPCYHPCHPNWISSSHVKSSRALSPHSTLAQFSPLLCYELEWTGVVFPQGEFIHNWREEERKRGCRRCLAWLVMWSLAREA